MKNLLLILISLSFIGCSAIKVPDALSSLELADAMSSEDEAKRILSLGLSHEENLVEASKLGTPHLVSVVTLKLTNARDEKIQNEFDLIESEKFSGLVKVTNNGLTFIGSEISESKKTGVLETDFDIHTYYLKGTKDLSTGQIEHKLNLTISHNSKKSRKYSSSISCDQWGRCDGNKHPLHLISSSASNCSASKCDYREIMEIDFDDDFLRTAIEKGFTLKVDSKKTSNKVKISKAYLMGYLRITHKI